MSTLLLRFAAPLQSWGNDSKYDTRYTQREPSKSGVVGFLAAALGRKRDEDLSDLAALKMAVRTDRQGQLLRDYHIVRKMNGGKVASSYVTKRYYLSDAVFLIGLESTNRQFLEKLQEALYFPAFPLFLGRRSCPPEGRVCLGIVESNLWDSVNNYPLLVSEKTASYPMQIMIDSDNPVDGAAIGDYPVSFSPFQRKYVYRLAEKYYISRPNDGEHDPMKELR